MRILPLACAAVWVACACASSANSTGGAGSGGPSGAGATAASGGGSGVGGGSAGGGAGAAAQGGAGGTPMTATEVCQAAIQTQCDRVVVCDGALVTTNCIGFANPCPEYYFNSASNRTVAGIAACLPALAARTCTDIALDLYPSCFVDGNLPAGSGCAYPSQCGSGNCGAGEVCATCRAGGVPVGGSCATATCVSGAFCHNGVCAAGSAVLHATQGQPCDLNGDPVTGCVGDLLCIPSVSGGTTGTCTPAPGAGQPCATMSPTPEPTEGAAPQSTLRRYWPV